MNRTRVTVGLLFLGAALCLGLTWAMDSAAITAERNSPPMVDAPGMVMVIVFMLSCVPLAAAFAFIGVAIWRLRRK